MKTLQHRGRTSSKGGFTFIEALIVSSIIALLATLALPAFMKPREQAQKDICQQHLRLLDSAKDLWALESNQSWTAIPDPEDLDPYIKGGAASMTCPLDPGDSFATSYEVGRVDQPSTCKIRPGVHSQ
jgi:prepilin-type N-terminal cleavage/methylation domain-containing protein